MSTFRHRWYRKQKKTQKKLWWRYPKSRGDFWKEGHDWEGARKVKTLYRRRRR